MLKILSLINPGKTSSNINEKFVETKVNQFHFEVNSQ